MNTLRIVTPIATALALMSSGCQTAVRPQLQAKAERPETRNTEAPQEEDTPQQMCYACKDSLIDLGREIRGRLRDIAAIATCTEKQQVTDRKYQIRRVGTMAFDMVPLQRTDVKKIPAGKIVCVDTMKTEMGLVERKIPNATCQYGELQGCMEAVMAVPEDEIASDEVMKDAVACVVKILEPDSSSLDEMVDIDTRNICEHGDDAVLDFIDKHCVPKQEKLKNQVGKVRAWFYTLSGNYLDVVIDRIAGDKVREKEKEYEERKKSEAEQRAAEEKSRMSEEKKRAILRKAKAALGE